jgi:hypothetical protein
MKPTTWQGIVLLAVIHRHGNASLTGCLLQATELPALMEDGGSREMSLEDLEIGQPSAEKEVSRHRIPIACRDCGQQAIPAPYPDQHIPRTVVITVGLSIREPFLTVVNRSIRAPSFL